MTLWTIPEYIDAHPTVSPVSIIELFVPTAPDRSDDKLSDWYTEGYQSLEDQISEYQDALADGEMPDAALKMSLLTWGTANIDEEKPELPDETITPTDPEDPIAQNAGSGSGGGSYGNIRAYVIIGSDFVSEDVISMTASMSSGYEEGNEQAKCEVVLHNNGLYYGKKIASYEWAPRVTRIWSMVSITYHDKTGGTSTDEYMFFQGFMADAKYTHENATITFSDATIISNAAYDDIDWSPEDGYEGKMQDVIDKINEQTSAGIELKNLKTFKNPLIKQFYAPSDLSGSENLRSIANDNKEGFYFACDFEDNMYVVLVDKDTVTGFTYLDPYVIEPGDTSNIFGVANEITVVGGTTDAFNQFMRHVPTNVKDEVFAHKVNSESVARYNWIPANIQHDPNLPPSQLDIEADIADDTFQAYVDRDIKVSVANRIPKILGLVMFQVTDVGTGEKRNLVGGVKKKQIEYSASGIISHLEIARIKDEMANAFSNTQKNVKTSTDRWEDSNGVEWQYNFDDGEWQAHYEALDGFPLQYTDDVPQEVIDHFRDIIRNIEQYNDNINPNWRTAY